MDKEWKKRLERTAGLPDLAEVLTRLSPGDLQSLLLEVYARRSSSVTPAALLESYRRSRFTPPSPACPRQLNFIEATAHRLLPSSVKILELSPVAPLGACSALATVHQNKILSTARNLEVAADPTNALALECALRRSSTKTPVHLAAHQRVVRAQALPTAPSGEAYYAHFGIFALCSAFRWSREAEAEALHLQLDFLLKFLTELFPARQLTLAVTDLSDGKIAERLEGLKSAKIAIVTDPERSSGRGYYEKYCYKLHVDDVEVGDGGRTNWIQQLLDSRKEALLIGGLGMERLVSLL